MQGGLARRAGAELGSCSRGRSRRDPVTLVTATLAGLTHINQSGQARRDQVDQFYIKPPHMCSTSGCLEKASYFPSLPAPQGLFLLSGVMGAGSRFTKSELSQLKVTGIV